MIVSLSQLKGGIVKRKDDKFEEDDDDNHTLRTSMEQEEGYCVVEALSRT